MLRTLALALALAWLAAGVCGAAQAPPARPSVTAAELQQRIDELVARVRAAQQADGSIVERREWTVGQTSLAVLALRAASVPPDDPAVQAAVRYLGKAGWGHAGVYETSLRLMALQSVDPVAYRAVMASDASNLVSWQDDSGGWGYPRPERPDASNAQFALLGLNAAATSGADASPTRSGRTPAATTPRARPTTAAGVTSPAAPPAAA